METNLSNTDLNRVLEWARHQASRNDMPPWVWYQYMKLAEAAESILSGLAATSPTADLLPQAKHPETFLQLAVDKGRKGISQHPPECAPV